MKYLKMYFSILILFLCLNHIMAQEQNFATVGAMNQMLKTNYMPQIWLDTLTNKSHLYGLGPYGKLQGEITIVDGKPFYASAFEKGKPVIGQTWHMKSPFFVSANVENWNVFEISDSITSVKKIQQIVASIAKSKGYNTALPFVFKIRGVFDSITNHIVTPRSAEVEGFRPKVKEQNFSFKNVSGEIIGFYSEKHHGVFTGSKSNIHVHFLKDDLTFMGHLDKINTAKNSLKLYLPAKFNSNTSFLKVNDTDFSKGRLGNIQELNLNDLEKFHGHLCDGLVVGFLGIKEGLKVLYPNGIIDRTNTRIVSKGSPCLTDAAVYLTGGRYQFDSFYVSNAIDGMYVVQRIDNGKAVVVNMNKGVKPAEIDELGALAVKGELPACDLDKLKIKEDDFSRKLLSENPKNNFTITEIKDFQWNPVLKNDYLKTDILNKNKPKCNQ